MTKINDDDVRRAAQLSSLALGDEDIKKFRAQFETILAMIDQLDTVDVSGVQPTYQVTGLKNVMRDDTVIDYGVAQFDLLKNAPSQQDSQIKVRRVL